jgi:hypothetical protein
LHRRAIHLHEFTALEPIDARSRAAVVGQDRSAIAVRVRAELDRRGLAGAEHHITLTHAERKAAAERGGGVWRSRGRGGRRLRRHWRRAGSIAVDEVVCGNRALPLFRFLQLGKSVTAILADDVDRLGEPRLAQIDIGIGAAG